VIVSRLTAWATTAVLAAALAPPVDPWLEPGLVPAVAAGVAAGVALFACLARRRISPTAVAAVPRRRLAARTLVVTLRAVREEAVWRGVVLGLLADPIGRAGALVATTVLFAASHLRLQGVRAAVHLTTGSVFGVAYLATGRLGAAMGAHSAYNVLVGMGLLAHPDMSRSATSEARGPLVRSPGTFPARSPDPVGRRTVESAPIASLVAVTKSFGAARALVGVDLDLRRGEVLGLLGPNGAGKSTAISLLLGLRRPDSGHVLLFGRDPRDVAARERLGVVLQEPSLPPVLRAGELLDLVRAHYRDPVPRVELLARFELDGLARAQIGGLSGGQRRRLALAAALAGRPEALLLDEPTAAIDAGGRRVLWAELSTFVAGGGAVLLTTQQLEEAERYATRIVVIARGRVVGAGSVDDVRARVGRTRITLRAERLPSLPAGASVSSTLDRHVIYVDDAEAFVAELVRSGVPYRQLEVTRPSLEDAVVSLIGDRR
jgi:ABC-2 type transport system ATP-binding protein